MTETTDLTAMSADDLRAEQARLNDEANSWKHRKSTRPDAPLRIAQAKRVAFEIDAELARRRIAGQREKLESYPPPPSESPEGRKIVERFEAARREHDDLMHADKKHEGGRDSIRLSLDIAETALFRARAAIEQQEELIKRHTRSAERYEEREAEALANTPRKRAARARQAREERLASLTGGS